MAERPPHENSQPSPARSSRRAVVVVVIAVAVIAAAVVVVRLILHAIPGTERSSARVPKPAAPHVGSSAPVASSAPSAPSVPSASSGPPHEYLDVDATTLAAQRDALLTNMHRELGLSDAQLAAVRSIIEASNWMGQGNPKVTEHPMTRAQCRKIRSDAGLTDRDPQAEKICGARNMAPLYDPKAGQTPEDARVCIDRFEFPNIPCEYPLVWVRADEAAALCSAEGKRICDAGEWEGACAGRLLPPNEDYLWKLPRLQAEYWHNKDREIVWSYGLQKDHALCATGSRKSKGCNVPSWQKCGSNTYPAGAFPKCVSKFGVYDLNGNAAEHMNMPLKPDQLASRGGSGETEMKGSWFIFLHWEAHPDDCRWRAPMWHVTKLMSKNSHRNYHLGFRCCKNVQ